MANEPWGVLSHLARPYRRLRDAHKARRWRPLGCQGPAPHAVKQQAILRVARSLGCTALVETETFRGDMVEAMRGRFEHVTSIELSPELHTRAQGRFHGVRGVRLIQGDSASVLAKLAPTLDHPTLFWLDGHWSGGETARGAVDTPVLEELRCLAPLLPKGQAVLIDDARLFGTDPAYPTIERLRGLVQQLAPGFVVDVFEDVISILPAGAVPARTLAA